MKRENKLGYRYFKVVTYTPYCGEENDYYFSGRFKTGVNPIDNIDFAKFIDDCIFDNASDWYDEFTVDESFEEYLEECSANYEEISYKEFIAHMPA